MKINKIFYPILAFLDLYGGDFKLSLHKQPNNFESRLEKLQQISAPKKSIGTRNIELLHLLPPVRTSSRLKKSKNAAASLKLILDFLQPAQFYNNHASSKENYEAVVELQEELLAIFLQLAEGNEKYLTKGSNITKLLKCHYLGKRLWEKAENLMANAGNLKDPFEKCLIYNTVEVLYQEAEFFYNKSYGHLFEESEDDLAANERALTGALKKIQDTIQKMPMYKEYIKKLKLIEGVIEQNKADFNKALEQKRGLAEFEERGPLSKKDHAKIVSVANSLIDAEIEVMDGTKVSKDIHKQNIDDLRSLLDKKDYANLALKIYEFEVRKKKNAFIEQLTMLEEKYVYLVSLYLELFKLFPRIEHIEHAENVMETITALINYKIACNPCHITIVSTKELWDTIKAYRGIINHSDNVELHELLQEVEECKRCIKEL